MKSNLSLTWGLFKYRGRHWLYNFRDIPILLRRIIFLLRHGYPEQLTWNCDETFITLFIEVLKQYRDTRHGAHDVNRTGSADVDKMFAEENIVIDKMILVATEILEFWNEEYNSLEEHADKQQQYQQLIDNFFGMLSKYWPMFWD